MLIPIEVHPPCMSAGLDDPKVLQDGSISESAAAGRGMIMDDAGCCWWRGRMAWA